MSARPYTTIAVLLAGLIAAGPLAAQFSASDEYAMIGYASEARHNPVARLHARLAAGEVVLDHAGAQGYLGSLLDALDVDPASQTLVFSATSLQRELIAPETPRALYFNDTTYVGYVQKSSIVEIATIDDRLGLVFYTFDNRPATRTWFERANQTCLVCHDSQGTMIGGTPMLMALSAVNNKRNVRLRNFSGAGNVTDATPIEDRWGGWYVTGRHGLQAHLGNVLLDGPEDLAALDDHRTWNLDTLEGAGYFDTSAYLRDTSDIVALLVLEHQLTVQNQITYVKFKAPAALERMGFADAIGAGRWEALPERAQRTLSRMLDKLVRQLLFADYAAIGSRISGSGDYAAAFEARAVRDRHGRSLRTLELDRHLLAYPLSYLILSSAFDGLPAYARDYVYRRIAAHLSGREPLDWTESYAADARRAALEILAATKPEFAAYWRH